MPVGGAWMAALAALRPAALDLEEVALLRRCPGGVVMANCQGGRSAARERICCNHDYFLFSNLGPETSAWRVGGVSCE